MTFAEDAIAYGFRSTQPFDLKQCVSDVAKDGKYTSRRDTLVAEGLDGHPNLVKDGEGRFVPRHSLFANARFRICPLEPEIDHGILWPGHRFVPFCLPGAPADESTVLDADGEPFGYQVVETTLADVAVYHSLIPLGQVPFLVPEGDESPPPLPLPHIWLRALDMAEWYSKHDFDEGDSIIVTVLNVNSGIYRVEYSPLEDLQRDFAQIRRSDVAIEQALLEVLAEPVPQTMIDTQLFHAYARVEPEVLRSPGRHLGAMLTSSESLTWTNDGYACYIHRPEVDPHEEILQSAAEVQHSPTGRGRNVHEVLEDLGVAVVEPELRAMIRDATMDLPLDDEEAHAAAQDMILDQLLPLGPSSLVSPEQEETFYADFVKLWASEAEHESRSPAPLPVAQLRSQILGIKTEVRGLLRELDSCGVQIDELPAREMVTLSQIDTMLTGLLQAMQSDPNAVSAAQDMLSEAMDIQGSVRAIIDAVREALDLG